MLNCTCNCKLRTAILKTAEKCLFYQFVKEAVVMSGPGSTSRRPYRKASEYTSQNSYSSPYNSSGRSNGELEHENEELRERLVAASRRMEQMEVEFAQSKEYLESSLDITSEKLNRAMQQHKLLKSSYGELQAINYELEQKLLKISQLENEKARLAHDVHLLNNKLGEARNIIQKLQNDNERLKNDCNIAVQLLECKDGSFKQNRGSQLPPDVQDKVRSFQIDRSQYNEYINPYTEAASDSEEDNSPKRGGNYSQSNDMLRNQLGHVLEKPGYTESYNNSSSNNNSTPVYSGKFSEKKLIKPDYPNSSPWQQRQEEPAATKSNSPWQMQQQPTNNSSTSSPWQMGNAQNPVPKAEVDNYASSAFAYGANPMINRRPHSANTEQTRQYPQTGSKSLPTSTTHQSSIDQAPYNHRMQPKKQEPNFRVLKDENEQKIFDAEKDIVMTLEMDNNSSKYYHTNGAIAEPEKSEPKIADLLNFDDSVTVASPLHGIDSIGLEFDPLSSLKPSISGKIQDSITLLQELDSPQHFSEIQNEIVPPPPEDFANTPKKDGLVQDGENNTQDENVPSLLDLPNPVEENKEVVPPSNDDMCDDTKSNEMNEDVQVQQTYASIDEVSQESLHSTHEDVDNVPVPQSGDENESAAQKDSEPETKSENANIASQDDTTPPQLPTKIINDNDDIKQEVEEDDEENEASTLRRSSFEQAQGFGSILE